MVCSKRTRLLLAFGEHPGRSCGNNHPANTRFFQAAVLPFIEDAQRNGKTVLVVHELNAGCDVAGPDPRKNPDLKALETAMKNIERNMNSLLSETLNAGVMLGMGREWFDWGYLESIVETNRRNPGAVRNIVEPLGADTVLHMEEQDILFRKSQVPMPFEDRVRLEAQLISAAISVCLTRSFRVIELVKRLRTEAPNLAIAVPRGYAHKGMAEHFDYSEFEMAVAYGMQGVPFFSSDAIVESFRGRLSQDELMQYARLSLYFDEYCMNAMREGLGNRSIWDVHAEARQYAFDKEAVPSEKIHTL